MKHFFGKIFWTFVLIAVLGLAGYWFFREDAGKAPSFRTDSLIRGDLMVSISATGTIQPEDVIDVGAQVAGQIMDFGADVEGNPVDYGSRVEAGTVLARIDDSLYTAQAAEAAAQLQSAQANLQRAEADRGQVKAKLIQAENDWQRTASASRVGAVAQTNIDGVKAALEVARANLASADASILQAKAAVAQAEAGLQRARRNLGYTVIKSPVKGVVIDRRVNIGQTVVASLNAPSLFLIAADLKRMQVWVAVNEADIGNIHPGIPVSFTVDAFPGETFRGEVGKVRLNASMTQNVVTYIVEVVADNASGRLLPYLTANVKFELDSRRDVLLAPNAALRWTPSPEQIAPSFRESAETTGDVKKKRKNGNERPHDKTAAGAGATETKERSGVLWGLDSGKARPYKARIGKSDGTLTEVEGENLTEGLELITGIEPKEPAGDKSVGTKNPFAPSFRPSGGGRSR